MILLPLYAYFKYFIKTYKKILYKNFKISIMSRKGLPAILVAIGRVNENWFSIYKGKYSEAPIKTKDPAALVRARHINIGFFNRT